MSTIPPDRQIGTFWGATPRRASTITCSKCSQGESNPYALAGTTSSTWRVYHSTTTAKCVPQESNLSDQRPRGYSPLQQTDSWLTHIVNTGSLISGATVSNSIPARLRERAVLARWHYRCTQGVLPCVDPLIMSGGFYRARQSCISSNDSIAHCVIHCQVPLAGFEPATIEVEARHSVH